MRHLCGIAASAGFPRRASSRSLLACAGSVLTCAGSLPQPLLFAMSDPLVRNGGKHNIKMLQRRAFSFLSTDCNTTHSHAEIKARECQAEIQVFFFFKAVLRLY
jgi:hypothetical protein